MKNKTQYNRAEIPCPFALAGNPGLSAAALALPELAPIPRRAGKIDKGAPGRAAPRRVLTSVEVRVFDPVERAIRVETATAYVRALPDVLTAMPSRQRDAALAYAKAFEEVEAGGAADPEAMSGGKGGVGGKEGRQFHAMRHVEHLRRIEAIIGEGVICLGRRRGEEKPVTLARLAILRAVALDGLSVAGLLSALRLGRSPARQKLILRELLAATARIADDLGFVDPLETGTETEITALQKTS